MESTEVQRTLENIVGGPYVFHLKETRDDKGTVKKGLRLCLEEWTIDAEKWAKANFGSMQVLFNKLMRIGCDDDETIDAAIAVAAYKLTDESRRQVDEARGNLTTEDFLRKNITYKLLAPLCVIEYHMIRDSIPLDLIEEAQKKSAIALTQMQGNLAKTKKKNMK